jgi:hypothetical protein
LLLLIQKMGSCLFHHLLKIMELGRQHQTPMPSQQLKHCLLLQQLYLLLIRVKLVQETV